MSGKEGNPGGRQRRDRLIEERYHDPYRGPGKIREPAVCPSCGAVATAGRWQWLAERPDDAVEHACPACRRISDRVPAGFLTLQGEFLAEHRDEIMNLARNKVDEQKAQHPLKRIMDVEETADGGVVITFTDRHLPRGVGEAIESAYEGDLTIQYTKEAGIVRVYWRR